MVSSHAWRLACVILTSVGSDQLERDGFWEGIFDVADGLYLLQLQAASTQTVEIASVNQPCSENSTGCGLAPWIAELRAGLVANKTSAVEVSSQEDCSVSCYNEDKHAGIPWVNEPHKPARCKFTGCSLCKECTSSFAASAKKALAEVPTEADDKEQTRPLLSKRSSASKKKPKSKFKDDDQVSPLDMSPEDRAQYDKPMSTTIKCVIGLSFFSLWQYMSISIARSVDELRGVTTSSLITEMLTAAARGIHYPPMIACLFVSIRMHILANTEGLGNPQDWCTMLMRQCTESQYLQYAVVVMLAVFHTRQKGDPAFTAQMGGLEDVHPRIGDVSLTNRFIGIFLKIALAISMLSTYLSVLGLMYGEYNYDKFVPGAEKPSPAFIGVSLLVGMYMFCYFLVWTEHPRRVGADEKEVVETEAQMAQHRQAAQDGGEDNAAAAVGGVVSGVVGENAVGGAVSKVAGIKIQEGLVSSFLVDASMTRTQNAALSAVRGVHKAPMLAILFLTCRLRAMQLDPWNGKPQQWVRMSFYLVCAAMFFEIIVGFIIGFFGREEKGYNKNAGHIFRSHWSLHLLLQFFNLGSGFGLWSVYISLMTMVRPDGSTKPFPPTIHCILCLSTMYFVIHGLLYAFYFLKHVLNMDVPIFQSVSVSAQASVNFNPMLCILFLSVRLHAVQVTNFTGSPQSWAQDMMYLCVFAVFIQITTSIVLPVISGNKSGFDATGNSDYDMGPTWAMYVVTVLKYFVIISLAMGMGVVCVSAYVITPETANYGAPDDLYETIKRMGYMVLIFLLVMLMTSAKVVGHVLKSVIEQVTVGGVSLKITSAFISVRHGYINLVGIDVTNPPKAGGGAYKTPNGSMVRVDNIVIKLDTWKMVSSFFKTIEIEFVALSGVNLRAAKSSCGMRSNLGQMMQNLKPPKAGKPNPVKRLMGHVGKSVPSCLPEKKQGRSLLPCLPKKQDPKDKDTTATGDASVDAEPEKKKGGVILRVLDIRSITCTFMSNGQPRFEVALGDLKVDDFAKDKVGVDQIIGLIISTLLKTLFRSGPMVVKSLWQTATKPCALACGMAASHIHTHKQIEDDLHHHLKELEEHDH